MVTARTTLPVHALDDTPYPHVCTRTRAILVRRDTQSYSAKSATGFDAHPVATRWAALWQRRIQYPQDLRRAERTDAGAGGRSAPAIPPAGYGCGCRGSVRPLRQPARQVPTVRAPGARPCHFGAGHTTISGGCGRLFLGIPRFCQATRSWENATGGSGLPDTPRYGQASFHRAHWQITLTTGDTT